ncbi:ribose-phosphate diphosphokinase [Halovenus sp. WSH3]|uniref:Ribose-phosphate pyrophosphokinase n=1 Tax=Halovenus carboxidivorans TaxID=2692199 RepID=A0A6B0T1C8_9EURY|nr:ribose-phosphate diphosphokinase [Halovenus carboxidivorans]MXR50046.1 ribose-phosphate diphosphokinase [Halovenus carboxidivorans]
MIVAGSATQGLAAELAAETGRPLARVSYDRFPDGERKVQVAAEGDRATIVASTVSDGDWVELLQLQDALTESGVETVTTVLPYMGYARQDKAFEEGDPVSARAMARAISTGSDRVLTVNPHEAAVCEFFDVPTETVDAAGRLAAPLSELSDPLFLSPDAGAISLAETVRDAYGAGAVDHFEKTRHSGTEVEIEPSEAAVDGRDVVLVDDIIATGSTMSQSVAVLNERDAARVFVSCVHPLLVRNAQLKLARAGVEAIYGTDTIERGVSEVSAAPAIADAL